MVHTTPNPTAPTPMLNLPRIQCLTAAFFIVASAIFFFARLISGMELASLYRTAMFASIVTNALAIKQAVGKISFNQATVEKISSLPTLPYLSISLFLWLNSDTFLVQILPLAIIYVFQVIEYVPKDDLIRSHPVWLRFGRSLTDFFLPRKTMCLTIAAHLELVTLVLIVASLLRMKGSLLQLLAFTQYLMAQYILSSYTTEAVRTWDRLIARLVNDPRLPPFVKLADAKVRDVLAKCFTFTTQYIHRPAQQPQQPNRRR